MSSALACVGLAVSDEAELDRMLKSVYPDVREIGFFDGVHVGRWQDDSGAALILGLHAGELVDFSPVYSGTSGGLFTGCRLLHESIAFAKVVDADGHQLTAMAFEAEQYRQLRALGTDVSIYPDADAFANSPASQIPRSAPHLKPPRNPRRTTTGPGQPGWPPSPSSPTAYSPTSPGTGREPACPAPSCTPPVTSADSPGSRLSPPRSAPRDSPPTCAWRLATTRTCPCPATSSAAPSSCPPPSTPPT